MKGLSDQQIIYSWKKNVQPWVKAVRDGEIESRLLVTNQAIMDAILKRAPRKVLDAGCGEGWLARELDKAGIDVLGTDVVPELVVSAQAAGGGRYICLPYEELFFGVLREQFDVVVCNFSLIGNESVEQLFRQAPALLRDNGAFIIQTIHPVVGCGDGKYEDGWREGSWAGFSEQFTDPAPWYFRTIESWKSLFLENSFVLEEVSEPVNPKTGKPASIIFTGVLNR